MKDEIVQIEGPRTRRKKEIAELRLELLRLALDPPELVGTDEVRRILLRFVPDPSTAKEAEVHPFTKLNVSGHEGAPLPSKPQNA